MMSLEKGVPHMADLAGPTSSEKRSSPHVLLCFGLASAMLVLWGLLHAANWQRVIYHDAWLYNFPVTFAVAKNMACAGMPDWLGNVDSGTPVSLYTSSFTIANPVRLTALFLMSCLKPGIAAAVYFQKAHIFILYLCLAAGMYVMGRVLFVERLSAVYLFAATLFAGLCMETIHSDQATTILFWAPWIVACAVRFHRERTEQYAHWYANAAVLLFSLQSLDQVPHLSAFAAGLALILYASLQPEALLEGVRLHWKRLWPAALMLLLTGAQLRFLLGELVRHVPSQRAGLMLDAAALGQNAFVQPTALIGSLLPLGFISAYDSLEFGLRTWLAEIGVSGGSRFIYRLDALMFFVGIVPLAFAAVFLLRPGLGRLRAGWGLFALGCLLAAMQDTHIFRLLFHLPFFDLFRSYLQLFLFGVFAVMVMSGYGLDALLTLGSADRRRVTRYALLVIAALAADAAVALGWLLSLPDTYATLPRSIALDVLIIASGCGALAWAIFREADTQRGMVVVIAVLAVSQAVYQAEIYRMLAIPVAELVSRFGLDEADRTPLAGPAAGDPNALFRKPCTRLAECYLSARDAVSLRLDREGTFLRSWSEAAFQPGLAPSVVEALSGVGHPVFWTSGRAEPYADDAQLTERLNASAARIGEHLSELVYVRSEDMERLGRLQAGQGKPELSELSRGVDRLRLHYRATAPFYLNAAIAYDPHWRVSVGGVPASVVRGNFGGLVLAVPAGSGEIEFRYVNRASELFFISRILMGLVGIAAAAWLAYGAVIERSRASGGRAAGAPAAPPIAAAELP